MKNREAIQQWLNRHPLSSYVLLMGILFFFWQGAIHSGFITLDTGWLVVENQLLASDDIGVFQDIFWAVDADSRWETLGAEFLPVRDISVWIDFQLFGDQWIYHHATSLVLYLLGCILVYLLASELLGDSLRGFVVAIVFGLLPVHLPNVVWLASRKDLLGMCFSLLSILVALKGPVRRGMLLSSLLFLLAIWSKNTSYCVVIWLFATIWLLRPTRWKGMWGLAVVLYGGISIVCVLLSFSMGQQVGLIAAKYHDSLIELFILQGRLLIDYCLLLVRPSELCLFHPVPAFRPLLQAFNVLGILAYGGMLFSIWFFRKRSPVAALGLVYFLGGLLPVSQVISLQNVMADRYLLMPSIGAVFVIASIPKRIWFDGVVLLVGLAAGISMMQRLPIWYNDADLLQDVVNKHPGSQKHEELFLWAQLNQGAPIEIAYQAVEKYPTFSGLHHLLATELVVQNNFIAAEKHYREAASLNPNDRRFSHDLGYILHKRGKLEEAFPIMFALTQKHPDYAMAWNSLAAMYVEKYKANKDNRDIPQGIIAIENAISLAPSNSMAWCNGGTLHYLAGQYDAALIHWQECVRLNPNSKVGLDGLSHLNRVLSK